MKLRSAPHRNGISRKTDHIGGKAAAGSVSPTGWSKTVSRGFAAHRDVRGLLAIVHPWKPSRAGGFGAWETIVMPPEGWRPGEALYVSFYQSDNYSGDWYRSGGWGWGTQSFIGHRFKQLLVNGRLAWEADVADEEVAGPIGQSFAQGPGEPGFVDPYRVVKITADGRRPIQLMFRVVDKVASTVKLAGDAYKRFFWSSCNPSEAARNFQTSVYFGDVFLSVDPQPVRPGEPAASSRARGARSPRSAAAREIPFDLVVSGPLPRPGYPVRSSVPFSRGGAAAGSSFGLRDPAGRDIPIATTEISHWPDGSIRWLLCEFVATRQGRYRLVRGAVSARPAQPVRIRSGRSRTTLSNGILSVHLAAKSGAGVFERIECPGAIDLGPMDFSIKLNRVGWRDQFTAHRRSIRIERANPVCASVLIEGEMLDAAKHRFGSWRARLHVWTGLPYLLVDWRLVNESEQAMAMLMDWSARVALPDRAGARVDFGPFAPGYDPDDIGVKAMGHYGRVERPRAIPLHADSELSCRQDRVDQARVYRNTSWVATAKHAPGFVNLRHPDGGVAAAMRWFAEEFPKGIVVRPDSLKLATLPESEDALSWQHDRPFVRIGRGEGKRQSFAIWLHDGTLHASEAERFNQCVQDGPRLFNRSWFIASGAIECGPARDDRKLSAWTREITPAIERTGIGAPRLGHREYWDTVWSNDYRGRSHIGLMQYLETGDPRWFRYFDAACTHNRDVDVIHYCPEHPDWVGANHSFGEDHTATGPTGNIGSNCDGMLDHYLMTGDPDSLEAARGFAERLLSCNARERSARNVGWPLAQVVRWFDQTGDQRFRRKAEELVGAARTYIEPRRGIFVEMHGCWSYRGAVPFMSGYLAFGLIRHHQLFGDAATLRLLKLLAAGLFSESRVAKGRFKVSPFPENDLLLGRPARARTYNGLIGGLAGYLYQVTGEPLYADWARECYDGIVERSKDPQITMDMLPIAGWMLHAAAGRGGRTDSNLRVRNEASRA